MKRGLFSRVQRLKKMINSEHMLLSVWFHWFFFCVFFFSSYILTNHTSIPNECTQLETVEITYVIYQGLSLGSQYGRTVHENWRTRKPSESNINNFPAHRLRNQLHEHLFIQHIQLNLSTTATLGTEESGRCGEVAVMGR